jgi:hypothetical protein
VPDPNRLAGSSSPYLRQHQFDPVDWYPWGEEALSRAKELDRPLFLSIGYSACHWCHVMGHESFADEATASDMNDSVVAVKVDREERPDIDSVYMEAVQAATGSGGWPMSVFATPDGRPFFAGTYYPDRPRHGTPAFRQVLAAVVDVWTNRRADVEHQADALADAVAKRVAPPAPLVAVAPDGTRGSMAAAAARLADISDPEHGGFGRAPKFPQPLLLDLLLGAHVSRIGAGTDGGARPTGTADKQPNAEAEADDVEDRGTPRPALQVALDALGALAAGGIWDHVGWGFSRYSVDREWLVPHFEKMLYDQALLGRVYLHAWQVTGDRGWLRVLEELVGYVLGDLRLASGALASAEDADSEGEEGRFYTWEAAEFDAVLGPELAPTARAYWGVTDAGNFEGRNILSRPFRAGPSTAGPGERPAEIERARELLVATRSGRVRPGLDDKVLTEWNAMMCATLAEAALAAGRDDWLAAAEEIVTVLLEASRLDNGRVLRTPAREGEAPILGYSTDLAWLVEACVRLAEAKGDPAWLTPAIEVADQLLDLYLDAETGGLFTTGTDAEALVVRPRELYDNVTPSATSVAAVALSRLAALSGAEHYADAAARLVASGEAVIAESPTAVPELLRAADLVRAGTVDVAVTGDRTDLVRAAAARWHPRIVIAWAGAGAEGAFPLLADRPDGHAYVCRYGECRLPVAAADALAAEIDAALSAESSRPAS